MKGTAYTNQRTFSKTTGKIIGDTADNSWSGVNVMTTRTGTVVDQHQIPTTSTPKKKDKPSEVHTSKVRTSTILGTDHLLHDYRIMYGKIKVKGVLLSAVYAVQIENVFKHNTNAPWFTDPSFGYLVTESDISLGSNESETYHAGAYQANYLTQKSSDELEMTFIETRTGDIAKSYDICRKMAFNKDGTVNEPKKYAFKISIHFLNPQNPRQIAFSKSWIVGVKSASTQASGTGRSEVVKHSITFQKLMPQLFLV